MSQVDFHAMELNIRRRLSAVNLSSCSIDKAEVERALQEYLGMVRLSPRAVTWARDSQEAHVWVARSTVSSVNDEIRANLNRVFDGPSESDHDRWLESYNAAMAACHGDQLEIVKTLLRGQPVRPQAPGPGPQRSTIPASGNAYMRAPNGTTVVHEEHRPLEIPTGRIPNRDSTRVRPLWRRSATGDRLKPAGATLKD